MQFGKRIIVCGFVLLGASAVAAETVTESIVQQLSNQGYAQITISRTLLGRSRIVAVSPTKNREIVVNPRTGEILRDLRSDVISGPTIANDDDLNVEAEDHQDDNKEDGANSSVGDDSSDDGAEDSGDDGGEDSGDGEAAGDGEGDGDSGGDSSGEGGGDSGGEGDGDGGGEGDD